MVLSEKSKYLHFQRIEHIYFCNCSAEMFGSDSASTETDKRRLALCKPSSAAGARSLVLRRENLHSRYGGGARAPRSHCAFFCNCQNVKLL